MVQNRIPTNREMAANLNVASVKLYDAGILAPEGSSALTTAASTLFEQPRSTWRYSIPVVQPVYFNACRDRRDRIFTPEIGVKWIGVLDEQDKLPFSVWDIALTLKYENPDIHCPRWHFDLANEDQPGPITHLQYGGHKHEGNGHFDTALKEPRWFTAPMDVILLCEMVAASFFLDLWNENLRGDPQWTRLVHESQQLCYPHFIRSLQQSVAVNGAKVVLDANWNDRKKQN